MLAGALRALTAASGAAMLFGCAAAPSPAVHEAIAFAACPGPRAGCAIEHNLAMTVADPADLVRPRRTGRRDPMRRDAMLADYAARETQESGALIPGVARLNGGTP
jgi:hypothetical protein